MHRLQKEMHNIIAEHARDCPAEQQIDDLIMAVTMIGTNGNAPTLDRLERIICWCGPGSPLAADLEIVKQRIGALNLHC